MLKGFIKKSDTTGIVRLLVQFFDIRSKGAPAGRKPVKDAGSPIRVIATAFLIFLLSQLVALFFAELILSILGGHVRFNDSFGAQFAYVLVAEGLALWAVLKTIKSRRLTLAFIGLGRRPKFSDLKSAAAGFAAFYVLLIIASLAINLFWPSVDNQQQNLGFNSPSGLFSWALAFVALVILPPLGEEPLIRGYLYSGLRARWRFVPAMLATSFLFGIAHLEFGNGSPLVWGAGVETFILSMVLVYLRENTGALYAGILVHFLNNAVAFSVHFHG